jgi:hypothetical protein
MKRLGAWTARIALTLALAALAPRGATALTLADLAGGASFSTGGLTFSDFDVTVTGDLSMDLGDYAVQVLGDGFRLAGPLSVVLGDSGTLLISYAVDAAGSVIDGASVLAPGTTIGSGAQAWVGESLLGPGNTPLGSLFAYSITGVGSQPSDATGFGPVDHVEVGKTIHVGGGMFAALPLIDERFAVVPEPLTLLLVGTGLLGLVIAGRRRTALA